jgi:RNA polymerase sigma-70 factor (ECF subfamily)
VVSGSTEEAEDIVQEALIRVERSLGSYRATGSVRSWLLRAVANQARNSRRGSMRRLRRDDLHAGLVVRVDEAAEDVALRHVEYVALAEALVELSVRDREVLGCRFVAGLSEAETSAVLDVPAGTVKSRTARALRRLEARLGDTEGGAGSP